MNKKSSVHNLFLIVISSLIAVLIAELFVGDYTKGFENLILKESENLVEHHLRGLYAYDPALGWVPASNVKK